MHRPMFFFPGNMSSISSHKMFVDCIFDCYDRKNARQGSGVRTPRPPSSSAEAMYKHDNREQCSHPVSGVYRLCPIYSPALSCCISCCPAGHASTRTRRVARKVTHTTMIRLMTNHVPALIYTIDK